MAERNYVPLAVVVRYTKYDTDDPRHLIDLKEAFSSQEEAEREVERLNQLVENKPHIRYFVMWTRYFPHGRNVQVEY